ncbi:MAG TPA: MFS transporter [Streptosporangiaceae bacterium]
MNDVNLSATLPAPRRRPVLGWLAVATAVGASSLAAGGTSSGMLGAELAGTDSVAGVPIAAVVVGSAAGALLISWLTGRLGRGPSLAAGYLVGAAGGVVVALSARAGSFTGLVGGCILFGVANAAVYLTRYAAADIGGPAARGRSVGGILFATAFGAIASPLLLRPSGWVAVRLGLPPLSGMFVVATIICCAAGAALGAVSTVEAGDGTRPLRHAAGFETSAGARAETGAPTGAVTVAGTLRGRDVRRALVTMALSNLLMVGVMAVAPVRMAEHGRGLALIGVVISAHVAAMFLPSSLAGWLADRVDPGAVARAGMALLLVAGCLGALRPESGTTFMICALVLLGAGWNFGVVGGSTMLIRAVPDRLRVRAEGIGEVGMGFAAAVAAPVAGVLVASGGLAAVWLAVAVIGLIAVATPHRPGSRF